MTTSPDRSPAERRQPNEPPEHHFLVQAPVPPLDVDGLSAGVIGTIAFAIASILTGVFYPELAQRGNGWWLGLSLAGLALGLSGVGYALIRRRLRRSR